MAKQGAYISDVHLLEQLNDQIKNSGEAMANINQNVISHLNGVRDNLERQLDYIQTRLSEAEANLSSAESALNACYASQMCNEFGELTPSCSWEESAVDTARSEVEIWRSKYNQGQQIVGECQREISDYQSGGNALIQTMSNQQTPKANQILRDCIGKLEDILHSDVGSSSSIKAAGVGAIASAGGAVTARVASDKFSGFNMGVSANELAIKKNNKELEKAFGITQGKPMSIAEADRQSANPNYNNHLHEYNEDPNGEWYYYNGRMYKREWLTLAHPETKEMSLPHYTKNNNYDYDYQYGVNCATASSAYALRARGFDVTAKGNPEVSGDQNTWLSKGNNVFKIWKNTDGSEAKPTYADDWMKKNHISSMTTDDYKKYFEDTCKEKGIYIVGVKFNGGSGHATILQRDDDGLHFIEPQVYESDRTTDGRRPIEDLITHRAGLTSHPDLYNNGILRVDDKLLDPQYAGLFNVNK